MTPSRYGAGELSQLLEDLAHIPRVPVPDRHFEGLPAGTQVGRFVVQREIGRGGFGVVYEALDPELGRAVAVKLLRPGVSIVRGEAEWIKAEAEAVARLNHPAIVTIFEAGRSEHGAYLVFELLRGEGLDARMERGGMTPEEVLRIATAVASALDQAHTAGVLHRDLKPVNVFLSDGGAVKVLDFGISQLFDRVATPGSGTPGYMAPEQRDGGPEDARTDLYALGVLLRNLLAACEPRGPTTPSGRRAAALKGLSEELSQDEPDRRPASASVVLARLEALQQHGRPAARRWVLAAGGALLVAIATWGVAERWRPREAPPGERLNVVLAPTRNESGAPELDHLSELFRTALADSPRLRVVAQQRSEAGLRELGAQPAGADAADWRKAAGRLGAEVVVFPEAAKDDTGFTVTLTGRDAGSDSIRFQARAVASTLEALPSALDRALQSLRRGAGERSDDLERTFRPVAELATPSLVAYREYALGMECLGRTTEVSRNDALARCTEFFHRALEADPSFALARFQAGRLLTIQDPSGPDGRKLLEAALSSSARLTRRDEALARAWVDHLDGNDDAALRRYDALVSDDPGDVQAIFLAGDLLFHSSRFAEASPYLARLAGLGAAFPWAFDHLVESLALSDRHDELARLLDGVESPEPAQIRPMVRGESWLGRHDKAVALARGAQEMLPGLSGSYLVLDALAAAGRMDEAEALARSLLASEPGNAAAFLHRVVLASKRGRSREAQRLVDAPPPELQGLSSADLAVLKASLAAGDRRIPRLRAEVQKLVNAPPTHFQVAAIQLALMGTPTDAQTMKELIPPGSNAAIEVEALEAWRDGRVPQAVAMLSAMERAHPRPNDVLSPAYLLAEVAREDDPSEALAAAARFRKRIPIGPARGWMYGRSLVVSAEAAWRLGRCDEALAYLDQVERLLAGADAGFPLAEEARRLRTAIVSRAPAATAGHFGPR